MPNDCGDQPQLQPMLKPPIKPTNGKIKLFCTWNGSSWTLDDKENSKPEPPIGIEIPEDELGIKITIHLKPRSSNLTFHPTEPMWAQPNSCPTSQPSGGPIATDQIHRVTRKNDKELFFVDVNTQAVDIYYALRFSDGSILDPVIKNGGMTLS